MEVVNGIPCLNCTDVERAKKAPTGDAAALNSTNIQPAPASNLRNFEVANAPLEEGSRGRLVNFGT